MNTTYQETFGQMDEIAPPCMDRRTIKAKLIKLRQFDGDGHSKILQEVHNSYQTLDIYSDPT